MNLDLITKIQWMGLDLPYPLIYNEKFKYATFGCDSLEGSCNPLFDMLPGTVHFKAEAKKGSLKKLAAAHSELVETFRTQQFSKQINTVFQEGLSECVFKKKFSSLVSDGNDPYYIFSTQPGYFKSGHPLISFMEIALPGLTEYEKAFAKPASSSPADLASDFIPIELNQGSIGVASSTKPEDIPLMELKRCMTCGGTSESMIVLKCGHSIDETCGLKYLNELAAGGRRVKDAVCVICGSQIEYEVLKNIDESAAYQLFTGTK